MRRRPLAPAFLGFAARIAPFGIPGSEFPPLYPFPSILPSCQPSIQSSAVPTNLKTPAANNPTAHSLHTAHCTMHIAHCTLHIVLYMHIAHCTLHIAHCTPTHPHTHTPTPTPTHPFPHIHPTHFPTAGYTIKCVESSRTTRLLHWRDSSASADSASKRSGAVVR